MPEVLYEEVIEVEERVVLHQDSCQLQLPVPLVQGNTGEKVCTYPGVKVSTTLLSYIYSETSEYWGAGPCREAVLISEVNLHLRYKATSE